MHIPYIVGQALLWDIMGAYCHTRVGCACALRAHPPPTTKTDSRLASIAAFAYNLCLWAWGPPSLKKIKKNGPEGPFIIRNEIDLKNLAARVYHQRHALRD